MAGTATVYMSDKRLHVQVRVHTRQVQVLGASASASCQGLMLLLTPSHLLPKTVPSCSPLHPCPPAHLLRTCPLQNQSLTQVSNPPPKPARELKPGPPATLVRCTHTSLSLLSIISITINRSAPLSLHAIASHHRTHTSDRVHANANTRLPIQLTCKYLLPAKPASLLPCSFALSSRLLHPARTLKRPACAARHRPCVSSSPCLLPTALTILPSRHLTDGLYLQLGSSSSPRTPSEPGLPPSGPSPLQ